MPQSSTFYVGMDVHKESIAVAYVAQAHDADVTFLGTIGTRQIDIDQLVRKLHSKLHTWSLSTKQAPAGTGSIAI
jgi:transposase